MARKPLIRIAVVESDPLRFVGFRAVFHSERDFELISSSLPDVGTQRDIDLVLLGDRSGQNLFDVMATLKATRPNLAHYRDRFRHDKMRPFSRPSSPEPRATSMRLHRPLNSCKLSGS